MAGYIPMQVVTGPSVD